MLIFKYLAIFAFLSATVDCFPTQDHVETFNLTVVHINDIHAHFEEINTNTSRCRPENQCFGGVARLNFKKNQIMNNAPNNSIFLNAGDFYQGTVWYTKFRYEPMIEFGNILNYTAMGLGNHDFDDSIDGLKPFAEETTFDLLASNILNNANDSFQEGLHYKKSIVKSVGGRDVGIIGYITRSTDYNFPTGKLEFLDEIESVQAEARKLLKDGVEIIIALGHSGYLIDIELAEKVPELDLVVGGHSHTFLYTDTGNGLPSNDQPKGDYPTYVSNIQTGKIIPVVQAHCYTKYLGHLELRFDEAGELLRPVDGVGVSYAEPVLLDDSIDQDPQVLEAMLKWQQNLTEYKEVLGYNEVYMEERRPSEESNIGDFICDAMAAVYNDTTISFQNNGGIRAPFNVGNITYEDVLEVLPFDNTVDYVTMTGAGLKQSLENTAALMSYEDVYEYPGFGIQVSGLIFTIIVLPDNQNSRITDLRIKNIDGNYFDVDLEQIYNIALPSFLAGGGEKEQKHVRGFFDENILTHQVGDVLIFEAVRDYIRENQPINQGIEGRFTVTTTSPSGATNIQQCSLLFLVMSSLLSYLC